MGWGRWVEWVGLEKMKVGGGGWWLWVAGWIGEDEGGVAAGSCGVRLGKMKGGGGRGGGVGGGGEWGWWLVEGGGGEVEEGVVGGVGGGWLVVGGWWSFECEREGEEDEGVRVK